MKSGARILVEGLQREGVETIFGVTNVWVNPESDYVKASGWGTVGHQQRMRR
jgi:thiamine pyrophosphate-dependent acetolactate synthase large subunit-like protein